MSPVFERKTPLPVSSEELFAWHERPGAFERLTPPWEDVRLMEHPARLEDGGHVVLEVRQGPVRLKWVSELYDVERGRAFHDRQIKGPFARWKHRHGFDPKDGSTSVLVDRVEYALPGGAAGNLAGGCHARTTLDRMFRYRHRTMKNDLELQQKYPLEPMRILVTGASGLIGSALVPFLRSCGHEVVRAVRRKSDVAKDAILWHPQKGFEGGAKALEGIDAVIHLAGKNIAAGRWSDNMKRELRESRVPVTRVLCETLAKMERKPRALISSSAVGIYPDGADKWFDEESTPGSGFLCDLAREWEEATAPARAAGIRVVLPRTGIVLSPKGGALKKMLPAFRLGLGGRLGSGRQYMSWIALDDMLAGFYHALAREDVSGAYNFVAPNPVDGRTFTRTLARVLRRPVGPPAPEFALRLALGDMADEALLRSIRARPKRLLESGYDFLFPELEDALRHVLGR